VATKSSNVTIVVDENYKEIEQYLCENCSVLNKLYFSNNTELDNSYSDREKATKFYKMGQAFFQKQDFKKVLHILKRL